MFIVLTYHSVAERKGYLYSTPPRDFDRQMEYLKRTRNVLRISDLEAHIARRENPPRNGVAITFDDGVKDNYLEAFPILRKHGVPATIFVSTSFIGKPHTNPHGDTFDWLDWNDMEEMIKSGLVDIQNHTHTHPLLPDVSADQTRAEIATAKKILEKGLGNEVRHLAYPKGRFNDEVKRVVAESHSLAFGSVGPIFDLGSVDPYDIPRINIYGDLPMWKFKLLLTPAYWRARLLRKKLKRL